MNPTQLLAHFDRISDAPDAIPRLRQFILDLAVRGKLVEQDPNDEPASELLKRIQAAKGRVKAKALPPIEPPNQTLQIPRTWLWTRLSEISRLVTSGSRDWAEFYSQQGAIFIRMGNLSRGSYNLRLGNIQRVTPPVGSEGSRTQLQAGDILISITGEVGLLGLIPPGFGEAYINQHTCLIRQVPEMNSRYIPELFRSPFAQDQFNAPQRGIKNSFRLTDVTEFVVPLPPLAEQHRIVAKVDELMALCDRLEAAQTGRESRRDQLAAASLHRLNQPADTDAPEVCREHARFYLNHLPRISTRPEQIKQLRQTILNLAVRGQLVPQEPKDEPVDQLLKRIRAEKSKDEAFSIPPSWAWIAVEQIGNSRLGKMLDKAKNKGTPQRYLRNVNVRWFDFDLVDVYEMRLEDSELDEFALRRGDVLICEGGEPGRAAVWDEREKGIYFQKAIHRVRFPQGVFPQFFVKAMRQSADSGRLSAYFTGVGIKHLTGKGLALFVFPLPPLAEQHRIVAKVDELMFLCDQLETQLTTAQTESRRLLEAVLHEALAPAALLPL